MTDIVIWSGPGVSIIARTDGVSPPPVPVETATAPLATYTTPGILEIATPAETRTGQEPDMGVSPFGLGPMAAFRATKPANQAISNTSPTLVTFGEEVFDVGGYYDPASSRWTPPAGPVQIYAAARWAGPISDGALHQLRINKNGSPVSSVTNAFSGADPQGLSVGFVDLADGDDYYEVSAIATTAAPTTIEAGSFHTSFSGVRIR